MRLKLATYLTITAVITASVYYMLFPLYQFGPLGGNAYPALLLGDGLVALAAAIASSALLLMTPRKRQNKNTKKLFIANIVVLAPAVMWIVGLFVILPLLMMG